MAIKILMPALSPTMTEGKLAKWLKQEGDEVRSGDVVAEIETDKATMEVEAADEGTLGRILIAGGTEGVAVNTPIAVLIEEGEDASVLDGPEAAQRSDPKGETAPAATPSAGTGPSQDVPQPQGASQSSGDGAAVQASPLARRMAEQAGLDLSGVAGSGPRGKIVKRDVEDAVGGAPQRDKTAPATGRSAPATSGAPGRQAGERVVASPLARRMAEQAGIDLAQVPGSGPEGRIIKRDIDDAVANGVRPMAAAKPASGAVAAAEQLPTGAYEEIPHSTVRKVIAERLSQSKREIPHFYVTTDCRIDALLDVRRRLNDKAPKEGDGAYKLSLNDFVIRAAALALKRMPHVNASWSDKAMRVYRDVDVSVAVATPGGLITPVIRKADTKSIAALSGEMRKLGARARDGKLMPEEYQGGGFTISNMGMYGVKDFYAIINPPQSAILAVSAAEQRPVVIDGALGIGTVMCLSLSVDHRVVDGVVGAEFLGVIKELLEEPLALLL